MKKIVIIGAGFAGLRLAKKLAKLNLFEIWIIDKNNYHQFQPLFYQVATSGLEPSSISFPLRKVFQNKKNVFIRCATVTKINSEKQFIETTVGEINYDYLVIANGATTNFFNNNQISQNAFPMKSVSEALFLRNQILQNIENALIQPKEKQTEFLSVAIVGAGPTGVELSGALAELRKRVLPKDYPELDFSQMTITLIEASPKVLSVMSDVSSKKSKEYLEKLGVNVLTSTSVTSYDGIEISLSNGTKIKTKNLIWAAGVVANTIDGIDGDKRGRGNRIKVNRFNQVEGFENIFAIGDVALMNTEKYPNGHPQVATVANEQADCLVQNLKNCINKTKLIQYEYSDKGSMATIGRHLAVVDLPSFKFQGFFAWLFWMFLHLMLILGVKNKILVFVNWLWKYFTFDQSLRLIIKPISNLKNNNNELKSNT
ncbi:MAG: NAD(P)/FAD-dependent oxidoreductase [Bacteroidetes bacterium]|nr:NAD(P)/FAD-dependent oxidoreductase [Bacteroidota bacterium]